MSPIRRLALGALPYVLCSACAGGPSAHTTDPLAGTWRIAVLPLANYSTQRDAVTRIMPLLINQLAARSHVLVIDPGVVEATLAQDPWLATDRIPPDLVDALGASMNADALILGAVLDYGYRRGETGDVPQVSLSLRLVESPGADLLWSAVHSRDGTDRESVFGLGRNLNLQKLAEETVKEIMSEFPPAADEDVEGARLPPTHGGTS